MEKPKKSKVEIINHSKDEVIKQINEVLLDCRKDFCEALLKSLKYYKEELIFTQGSN